MLGFAIFVGVLFFIGLACLTAYVSVDSNSGPRNIP